MSRQTFEFDKILDDHEKVMWSAKPKFWPYVLQSIPLVIFGLIWLAMLSPFIVMFFGMPLLTDALPEPTSYSINGQEVSQEEFESTTASAFSIFSMVQILFLAPFLLIGLGMLSAPVWAALAYRKEAYAITDKRVLISKGIIGTDFKMLDYDQIKNIEVNVGLIDKFFSTGTILIFTGEVVRTKNSYRDHKDRLVGLTKPYEVMKLLKQTSHDIKTDIEYPNKLRPSENPGYRTEYRQG